MTHQEVQELFGISKEKVFGDKTVREIREIHQKFVDKDIENWTGDELSREAGRLAVLLVNLGILYAHAKATEGYAEDSISTDTAKKSVELIGGGMAVTRAEVEAKVSVESDKKALGIYRYTSLLVGQIYKDTERLVSVIQSRLKTMTAELKSGIGLD